MAVFMIADEVCPKCQLASWIDYNRLGDETDGAVCPWCGAKFFIEGFGEWGEDDEPFQCVEAQKIPEACLPDGYRVRTLVRRIQNMACVIAAGYPGIEKATSWEQLYAIGTTYAGALGALEDWWQLVQSLRERLNESEVKLLEQFDPSVEASEMMASVLDKMFAE